MMEKIGTKKIQVSNIHKEEFDVYPCNCKVGDTIWFDDGIEGSHYYMKAKVKAIDPDHWWIYDDGEKELGHISAVVEDDEWYEGQSFSIAFKDIIYEEPTELVIADAEKLLASCDKLSDEIAVMNKDVDFLINEFKTNKKYFRQEPGRCTTEDVIKTVYEFAWAASRNYHLDH